LRDFPPAIVLPITVGTFRPPAELDCPRAVELIRTRVHRVSPEQFFEKNQLFASYNVRLQELAVITTTG